MLALRINFKTHIRTCNLQVVKRSIIEVKYKICSFKIFDDI